MKRTRLPKIRTIDGARLWQEAYAHQRGKLLKQVGVPDGQIEALVGRPYGDLPAPLRCAIETSGINKKDL